MKRHLVFCAAAIAGCLLSDQAEARKQQLLLQDSGAESYKQDWVERKKKGSKDEHHEKHEYQPVDPSKRPVFGILTEPLRGDMFKGKESHHDEDEFISSGSSQSYVPKAHVQFLEQAGIRVIPVDYTLPAEERFALMDQLSGFYLPGDSQMAVTETEYKRAFVETLSYLENITFEKNEHFPVFMMGNSMQTLVRARQKVSGNLHSMKDLKYESLPVEMVGMPHETYFFDGMSQEEQQAVFNVGTFFNKQATGLQLKSLDRENGLSKLIKPLATFKSNSEEGEEFVAIAEGIDMPLYVFTYEVSMTQFYFEDPVWSNDENVLDHSIIARKHAQFIANTIAEEGRQCNHTFDLPESVFDQLVGHKDLVSVVYKNSSNDKLDTMPKGMAAHEIYLQ